MRLGLSAKFTITVLVILLCTMGANTLYFLGTSTRLHEQQLLERGRALGRLVSLISPEAILGFDFLLLNDYTREVSSQPDVAYGAILTPQGVPISYHVDSSDPYIKKRVHQGASVEIAELIKKREGVEDLMRLEFPITHNNVLLGQFLVGLSRESLQSQLRRQVAVQAVVMSAIVLFLSAAIYGAFRFNVLFPIRRLIGASREVGRGRYTAVEVTTADELGQLAQAFNAMATEVKEEQAKLHRQANFDALTGLPNRMMAFDRIRQEIRRASRSAERFAVYFIDLDNFKNVNDSLGHKAGDELLIEVGRRLGAALRSSDTVARLGGDEFLVIAPEITDELQVKSVAERLLAAVAEPIELFGRRLATQCSIGVAIFPESGSTVEALMVNADEAMYQAKATQTGSAIFFTDEMNVRLRERMRLEQDLEHAIERGELALHYQPIVQAAGAHHYGAEVLLRWRHPERGFVEPAQFVPLAEASGAIARIGDWVLENARRAWAQR